jgi:DNA-binding CsgD family transcriptional regulator
VKTLDFRTEGHDNSPMASVGPVRRPTSDGDVRARAEAAAGGGSAAAALALMTAAAEDVEQADPLEAAVLRAESSWYALLAHGPSRALQIARAAVDLAGEVDGRVDLIVHARLGDALQWNGLYLEAQREWLRAAAARTAPDANLLVTRAEILLRAGELAAGRESAYAAAARAREAGDPESLRDALTYQVTAEIHLGLLREADASANQLDSVADTMTSGDRLEALGVHAWIDALFGDEDACRSRIAAAGAVAAALCVTPLRGMAAGLLALRGGRYEEAVAYLEGRLSDSSPAAATLSLRPFVDGLVEACARSGRHDRARALVAEVFDIAVATAQPRYAAIAFRMRGTAWGQLDDFNLALEHHRRWGNRFEEARTRLLYGEALRRAKRRKEAREQLSAATLEFAAVGAMAWQQRAHDEHRAAGARLARGASGSALTAQEQRVAKLVGDGLTNKEIAGRLVISTKTVEGHLRNIFEKLGVTSRTQVARTLTR